MNFTAIIITLGICCTTMALADKWIKAKEEDIKLEIERRKTMVVQYRQKHEKGYIYDDGRRGYVYDESRQNETV